MLLVPQLNKFLFEANFRKRSKSSRQYLYRRDPNRVFDRKKWCHFYMALLFFNYAAVMCIMLRYMFGAVEVSLHSATSSIC